MDRFTYSAIAVTLLLAAAPMTPAAAAMSSSQKAPAARSGSSEQMISKAQAKKDIEMDGYKNVQNLHQGKGGWVASAKEGGKQVSVLVNQSGVQKM